MNVCRRDPNEVGIVFRTATYRGSDDTHDNPATREGADIFCFHGIPLRLSTIRTVLRFYSWVEAWSYQLPSYSQLR
jgi:hypothetical protein